MVFVCPDVIGANEKELHLCVSAVIYVFDNDINLPLTKPSSYSPVISKTASSTNGLL